MAIRVYGYVWACGCLRVLMGVYGVLVESVDKYKYVGVYGYMGVYRSLWDFVTTD